MPRMAHFFEHMPKGKQYLSRAYQCFSRRRCVIRHVAILLSLNTRVCVRSDVRSGDGEQWVQYMLMTLG